MIQKRNPEQDDSLIERWSALLQRPVTHDRITEISANLLGFFDTLSAWEELDRDELNSEVAA